MLPGYVSSFKGVVSLLGYGSLLGYIVRVGEFAFLCFWQLQLVSVFIFFLFFFDVGTTSSSTSERFLAGECKAMHCGPPGEVRKVVLYGGRQAVVIEYVY